MPLPRTLPQVICKRNVYTKEGLVDKGILIFFSALPHSVCAHTCAHVSPAPIFKQDPCIPGYSIYNHPELQNKTSGNGVFHQVLCSLEDTKSADAP